MDAGGIKELGSVILYCCAYRSIDAGVCRRILFFCGCFPPHFSGKKCPENFPENPWQILQNVYNKNPRHNSAEGQGQQMGACPDSSFFARILAFWVFLFSLSDFPLATTLATGGLRQHLRSNQNTSRSLAHRNRSDFCDLRLRCPSRTPEIARFPRQETGGGDGSERLLAALPGQRSREPELMCRVFFRWCCFFGGFRSCFSLSLCWASIMMAGYSRCSTGQVSDPNLQGFRLISC